MATPKGSGVQILKRANAEKLYRDLGKLSDVEVLVGFPEETTDRDSEDHGITNAALGYIHDTGMPEQNIPARPFMIPGIADAKDAVAAKLGQLAKAITRPGDNAETIARGMTQVGLIAKLAIQNKINEGIPPPLADATLRARAAKGRKGAAAELKLREAGQAPGVGLAKPLVDSGQLRNAVNYVIRSRRKRK